MKLKVSRTALLILAAGVLVVTLASMGMAYSGYQGTQSQLKQELAAAELRLANLPPAGLFSQIADLQNQITNLKSEVSTSESRLTQTEALHNRKTADTIYDIAQSLNVNILEFKLQDPTIQKIEKVDFLAMPLSMKVEGDRQDIIDFVIRVNQQFPTSQVGSVNLAVPRPQDLGLENQDQPPEDPDQPNQGEEPEPTEPEIPQGTIDMVIYSCVGK